MRDFIFHLLLILGLLAAVGIENNRGELPLYLYHQTWQGGDLRVLVSYDWRLGVQKHIVDNR